MVAGVPGSSLPEPRDGRRLQEAPRSRPLRRCRMGCLPDGASPKLPSRVLAIRSVVPQLTSLPAFALLWRVWRCAAPRTHRRALDPTCRSPCAKANSSASTLGSSCRLRRRTRGVAITTRAACPSSLTLTTTQWWCAARAAVGAACAARAQSRPFVAPGDEGVNARMVHSCLLGSQRDCHLPLWRRPHQDGTHLSTKIKMANHSAASPNACAKALQARPAPVASPPVGERNRKMPPAPWFVLPRGGEHGCASCTRSSLKLPPFCFKSTDLDFLSSWEWVRSTGTRRSVSLQRGTHAQARKSSSITVLSITTAFRRRSEEEKERRAAGS